MFQVPVVAFRTAPAAIVPLTVGAVTSVGAGGTIGPMRFEVAVAEVAVASEAVSMTAT